MSSWMPPNLQELCPPHSQVSTCQPMAMLFMSFLANLFGYSRDDPLSVSKAKVQLSIFSSFSDEESPTTLSGDLNGNFLSRSFDDPYNYYYQDYSSEEVL